VGYHHSRGDRMPYDRVEDNPVIDITTISTDVLEKDLRESEIDISVCQVALDNGINNYSGGFVAARLQSNKYFVELITKELNRRKGII
jgi:hypothetical protein